MTEPTDSGIDRPNISTEPQPKGSGRNPSDTLDREDEDVAPGQRALNDDASPESRAKSPMADAGSPGGTSGTSGTDHRQDR